LFWSKDCWVWSSDISILQHIKHARPAST
jgi:hypothetical protein